MIIRLYDNIKNGNQIFELLLDMSSPITSFLIENNLIKAPDHYYDNSLEGLKLRLYTKPSNNDLKIFINLEEKALPKAYKDFALKINDSKISSINLSMDELLCLKDLDISYINDLYENICDSEVPLDEIKMIEIIKE